MSDEYDDFEESLLREARRRSSPAGAKARAVAAVLAASASASLLIAIGRHLVALKLWAKSGAGLSTVVAMIGGSAILAAVVYGSTSVAHMRSEPTPEESPTPIAPEPSSDREALRVVDLPDSGPVAPGSHTASTANAGAGTGIGPNTAPNVGAPRPRSAPPRAVAAPMAPALDVPTEVPSEAPSSGLGQLGQENALVQTAQSALRRGDIQSAEGALAQHQRQFGSAGALASEAEVLRIEVLARTGRRAEAEARARELITSHPSSSLVRRVRVILGRDGETR